MRSTTEQLEGNVVRLSVEIDEAEVEGIVTESYRTLSRQARVPGFRPGKVPRRVLEARLGGAKALRAEALRDALPELYGQAVTEANLDPIAPPEIDITSGAEAGPVSFDAVVQVRPVVGIPGYAGLRVEVSALEPTDEEVDEQVDRMRDTEAELVEVGRPAVDGDHVTIDLRGTDQRGEDVVSTDDLLYEVGSETVGPELDTALRGSRPGDMLTVDVTPQGAAGPVALKVLVKDVKEKRLPEVTDEWAAESSEFATVEELRADIRRRIGEVKVLRARLALHERALAALADLVDEDEVPAVLVDEEIRRRLHQLEHRLADQRVTLEQFLAANGRSTDDLVAELRATATGEVKGDLALYALAEAEQVELDDDELAAEIDGMAARLGVEPEALRARLEHEDRLPAVRSEGRKRKAFDWLLEHVEVVDPDGNPVPRAALQASRGEQVDEEESDGTAEPSDETEATTDDA